MYFIDQANTKIFELQKVSGCGRKSSWMIDDSVYKGTFSKERKWRARFHLFLEILTTFYRRFNLPYNACGSIVHCFANFGSCKKQGKYIDMIDYNGASGLKAYGVHVFI